MYMDMNVESDVLRVWHLVLELSEQLAHNQQIAATLQSQAVALKNDAGSNLKEGYNLRRFNCDITTETFESELERTNAQIVIENQTLHQENKQLGSLLKEYETTMDTVVTKFRNHALAASQHESTLTRHYESLIYARETQALNTDLHSTADVAHSLQRLTHHLRALLRSMAGEDAFPEDDLSPSSFDPHEGFPHDDAGQSLLDGHPFFSEHFQQRHQPSFVDLNELGTLLDELEKHGYGEGPREEWAVEREKEISRLEEENAQLRKMLGIDEESMREKGLDVDPSRMQVGTSQRLLNGSIGGLITRHSTPNPPQRVSPFQRDRESQQSQQPPPSFADQDPDTSGAPLQRAADLPRMAGQAAGAGAGRRTGIFGRGATRPNVPTNLWSNVGQTAGPAPPLAWPGGSGVDLRG
ncbi:hypothetical protein DL96DRAFT_1572676 [Flagelloscypha sp. PMI_526]|nr:hypothetical protein DL96DRAFT_1572676 [Flagelloscypha sp. PMI_526]